MKMGTKGLISHLLLITYNSACSHPLVVAIGAFMLILYKHFPLVFGFLVSSSPAIAFTFLFLGIILNSSRQIERGVDDRSFSMDTLSDGGCKVGVIGNAKKDIAGKAGLAGNSVGNGEFPGYGNIMDEVMPIVDELDPLLDIDAPLETTPNSDTDSSLGSEKAENDEGGLKDGASEVVVKWTADDEKNLRDVGTSELERNQRLEHLIAKRRARIFQRAETEKNFNFLRAENERNLINLNFLRAEAEKNLNLNLIDLDSSNDPPPSVVEELSRLLVVIPPRRNPFDEPDNSPDLLIQVPGSAPSVLLPRHTNPFDLPFDHVNVNVNVNAGGEVAVGEQNQHHLLAAQSREMLFRPYFVPERMDLETSGLFQSQFSEATDSKQSSALELESETVSNDESHSSREDDIVTNEPDFQETNNTEFSTSEANEEEETNNIGVIRIRSHLKSLSETNVSSPRTYMIKKELVEERYDDSTSSAYSEESEEEVEDSSSSCSSLISALARTEIARKPDEVLGERQVVEPVYDSSPSALENSISNLTSIEDALLYLDKGSVKSTSSDMKVEASESGSSSQLNVDENNLSVVKAAELTEITESVVVEPSVGNNMTKKSVMDGEKTSRSNANGNKVRLVLPLNMLVIGNDHTPREDLIPPPSPPSNFGIVENRVSILPSIPEEMLDELKHEASDNSEPTQQTEMQCSTNENSGALEKDPIALSTESQTSNEMTRTVEDASNGLGDKSLANNPGSKATELIKTLIKKNSRKFGVRTSTSSSSSSSDSD